MITLKDVAKAAGFSLSQTSRALNDCYDVSIKTKEKVRTVAQELGYVKNIMAQNLATSSSNQLGFIVAGSENDHNSNEYSSIYPTIRGMNNYLEKTNYELGVYFYRKASMSYLQFAQMKRLAGIVISGINYDDPYLEELLESNLPCVLIDIPVINREKKGCVVINNALQAGICVDKLLQIGKKNIIMISGHLHAMVSLEREMGFKTALVMHHMPYSDNMIFRADFDENIAEKVTQNILKTHPEVDGIFCASDFMAIGCMKALKQAHKKIPQDVAVIGFDGIPQGGYVTPTLTTIVQNNYQNGVSAAQLLCDFLNNVQTPTNTITLDCTLLERQSTGD